MGEPDEAPVSGASRILRFGENTVYALAGVLLVATSVAVLAVVGYHLASDLDDGVETAAISALDGLLLVFILLELLAGVRATMVERKLVAEPFLIIGIIASIKEIIVIALKTEGDRGSQQSFDNAMTEMAVLGALVVLLAVASFLVRRKEREPTEG
ncbi:MAG: phosphate-starvation-inducible PsiE family protein [Acidimicrobiales bacterium]